MKTLIKLSVIAGLTLSLNALANGPVPRAEQAGTAAQTKISLPEVAIKENKFSLPPLPYEANALSSYIDEQTMKLHHDKHHQTYVDKLNEAVSKDKALQGKPLEELFSNANIPDAVRNHGGGHWNHSFFWKIMTPKSSKSPTGDLALAIKKDFGTFEKFKDEFAKAANGQFGSGWAWLIVNSDGKLQITSTQNQDNPLMSIAKMKGTPVLGLDVWEHAYYLKYQDKRADYVTAFWNVVNWDQAEMFFDEATGKKQQAGRIYQDQAKSTDLDGEMIAE